MVNTIWESYSWLLKHGDGQFAVVWTNPDGSKTPLLTYLILSNSSWSFYLALVQNAVLTSNYPGLATNQLVIVSVSAWDPQTMPIYVSALVLRAGSSCAELQLQNIAWQESTVTLADVGPRAPLPELDIGSPFCGTQ